MNVGRVIGVVVVILVLFAIVADPQDSAATTRDGVGTLGDAGNQLTVFMRTVVADVSDDMGTSTDGSSVAPRGGVEAGDGSTEPRADR